ncbi:MAG: TonB-dependent receptor [Chitinophagaceae bacterium]|nr:TonB-dependent receptor [Chitinophagaceae bacterium]HQX71721.1 carboxypeptidase regulatory-like domain-containing protein [Chitinophagaceae bacterium]
MLKRIVLLFVVALVASPLLFAQITTSAINGAVKNNSDEPLVGATIVATHQPSGTKYSTVSRAGGQFSIQNMRVGGPYLIEISYVGHDVDKYDNIYLQLAESFLLNPLLTKTTTSLENVVITTGRRSSILNASRTGSVTNIGIRQINQLPTISRSINDLTRATPQSNGASIGGGNYRQNNFTVDGSDFNNSFGIGSNLPAGGAPISLDALEEISVNLTPFDIRQTGFIGSAINAVTRSGTNTFTGSVYTYFRNEKHRGRRVEKTYFTRPAEEFKQYGFRVGGPIIKNKLFFFFNYETEKQPKTIQTRFASSATRPFGSSDNIVRPSADSLNFISQYLFNNYGYVTGPFDGYTPDIERTKYMLRLDWNISSRHRFNIRYSQVEGGEPNPPSTSTSGAGFNYPSGLTRTGTNSLWYKNSNYFQGANLYSIAAELNSSWGRIANTLRGTYTYQNDSRESESQVFPFVDILSTTGVSASSPYTSFGYEPFSFGNLRKVKTYSIIDNLTWTSGKHNWTVGGQFDLSETINGFQRFATSYYVFNTWADFASALNPNPALRVNPRDFAITYSLSKDFAPAFSAFKFAQYSVYGQDEISLSKNFRLTVGLRLDLPTYPDVPQIITHPLVAQRTFAGGEKINTGNLPDKRIMWSPRFGFNWDIYGDRSLQIRGGTGVFTGRVPFVWIVSQSGDNGMLQITQAFNGQSNTPGPFNPDPAAYRPATVPTAGTIVPGSITALSPDFKNPQSWKSTLAMDTKLPGGIVATIEALFTKDLNTAFFRNANLQSPAALNVSGYPDNRAIYGSTVPTRFINTLNSAGQFVTNGTTAFNSIVLDNGSRGYYFSLTAKFEKPFSKGFYASVAYTKSLAGNLFDGGGDQPLSAWQGTATVNGANTSPMGYADYVLPDRVVGLVSYRKEYFKHLATTISMIYNGGIAGRFSYVYGADFNRDGVTGNDLIYIPTAAQVQQMQFASQTVNGVVYDQTAQRNLFESYILQDKYLKAHRGQYAERNGAQIPWLNRVDLKFMQDIFANVGKSKNTIQFTLDIFNFGNMINPSWGKLKSINASSILVPTNQNSLIPGGSVVPQFRLATAQGDIITRTFRDNVTVASTYSVQFGLRYIFN